MLAQTNTKHKTKNTLLITEFIFIQLFPELTSQIHKQPIRNYRSRTIIQLSTQLFNYDIGCSISLKANETKQRPCIDYKD